MNFIHRILSQYGILIALAMTCCLISFLNPVFLTVGNLSNLLVQATTITLIAIGMTFVVIAGGIDLSVGSIVALSGIVFGAAMHHGWSMSLAAGFALSAGACCGLINGSLVSYGNVPPFVATLGMMGVARGAALLVTNGRSISGFPDQLLFFATGKMVGVPMPVLIMITVFGTAFVILEYTYWGKYIYAMGDNREAARLSGIAVRRYTCAVYGISGLLAGLGSIILTARLNSAQPIAGNMYELDAIAAVVIGGASLAGGRGTIIGTVLGAMMLSVLRNGLSIVNVSSYWQQIVIGVALVMAVLFDAIRRKVSIAG